MNCARGLWAYGEATGCIACAAGKYSTTERAGDPGDCLDCLEGYYSTTIAATTSGTCQRCSVGLHAPPGATTCTTCPSNSYTGPLGPGCLACPALSTSPEGASLEQCVCVVGYLRLWSQDRQWFVCNGCSAGTYTTQNNASSCTACAPGKFATNGAAVGVSAGTEEQGCTSCLIGQFSSLPGQTSCGSCAAGTYANTEGQRECSLCPPGFSGPSPGASACSACTPGHFSNTRGRVNCSDCSAGTFTSENQSSSCGNCSAGTFSELMAATGCSQCAAGTYSSIPGAGNVSQCQPCQQGRFSTSLGATSKQVCRRCPVGLTTPPGGTACFSCPAGEFPNQMYGACASCPKHSVSTANATTPEGCRCGAGYFLGYNSKALGGEESYEQGSNGLVYKVHTFNTHDEGILIVAEAALGISCNGVPTVPPYLWRPDFYPPVATPSTCPLPMVMSYPVDIVFDESETSTHMQCVPCPRGTFSANGGTEDDCLPCPSGQYQEGTGRSACEGCPPGTWTYDGGDACIPCQLNTYQAWGVCVPCPDGYYTLGIGVTACIPCPNNMWSNNVSGGCRNCPREAISTGGTGVDGCLCAGGHSLFLIRNTPYCAQCSAGTFAATGTNRCVPCPPGTFGNLSGMDSCFACPRTPVVYVALAGASTCTTCGPGKAPATDQGGCIPCPIGKYCPGNSSIVDCPPGSFMTTGNVTSLAGCLKCSANFFCVDAVTKEPCPAGTYSNPGAMDKHDCQCLDQYECAYSTVTTKKVSLAVTPEEFEARRAEFIAALAAAWGVSADSIRIVSVQSSSSQTLRRVLRPGIVQGSARNSRPRQTTVTIVVKIKKDSTEADIIASKILRERGLPALGMTTFNKSLDF